MDRPHRSFDPRRVGELECETWVTYYRHEWLRFLRAALDLTRHTFGLPWRASVYGAWLVLRANMQWAPRDNDPVGAKLTMQRFYALVKHHHHEDYDPVVAAELEVEWWRVHRAGDEPALVAALTELYAYLYGAEARDVRRAAEQRALAMRYSDRWVREGRARDSPLVGEIRGALVRSYAALLPVVRPA
ncbi:MAG TPA: hypothetical protein VE127_12860 [Solirubrobacteraceae bacterium]|nr:hypothetical protein [Solirubrobacteraceae bacterium]